MSAITTEPARLRIPTAASIQAALAEPFERRVLKCKPGALKGNQALAMPYLDARDVADRLDEVLGLDGWQDDYEQLADGPCSGLRIKNRPNLDRPLRRGRPERAARCRRPQERCRERRIKAGGRQFGVARYLYRLPNSGWAGTRLAGSSPKRLCCRPGCRNRR